MTIHEMQNLNRDTIQYASTIIRSGMPLVGLRKLCDDGYHLLRNKKDRVYIEKGNKEKLSAVEAFTFEPHISLPNSPYGFKKENIYTFQHGSVIEL